MPRTKPVAPDIERINPDFFYRKHGATARAVIGLGASQTDEMIKAGKLPPPIRAFEGSKAIGWLGSQLIQLQKHRLARAQTEAERLRCERASQTRKR
jgi:predicted DNA-binding transcriptional regulator AlpA